LSPGRHEKEESIRLEELTSREAASSTRKQLLYQRLEPRPAGTRGKHQAGGAHQQRGSLLYKVTASLSKT